MVIKRLDHRGDIWSLFKSLGNGGTPSFLLDSSNYHHELGRFSFMGWKPRGVLRSRGRLIEYWENNQSHCWEGDPLAALEKVRLEQSARLGSGDSPFPFNAGLVGYISYDMGKQIEKLNRRCHDDLQMYDQYWGVYDGIVAADHLKNELWIAAYDYHQTQAIEEELYAGLENTRMENDSPLWMGDINSNFRHCIKLLI